jgi:hypothetical protein
VGKFIKYMSFENRQTIEQDSGQLTQEEVKRIIVNKPENLFFQQKISQEKKTLEGRDGDLAKLYLLGNKIMTEIPKNPQVLDKKPKFFHARVY